MNSNFFSQIRMTVGAAMCWSMAAFSVAQEPVTVREDALDSQQIKVLYEDYARARFAVEFDLTAATTETLRTRLPRFWYLLLYTTDAQLQRQNAPTLRFGFFETRGEADRFVQEYASLFDSLRTVSVSPQAHQAIFALADEGTEVEQSNYYWLSSQHVAAERSMQALLDAAKEHYVRNEYMEALFYYRALSVSGDPRTGHWARELMALSYERLGYRERAITVYETLLQDELAPASASRVAQRLRALQTAADDGKTLRQSKYDAEPGGFYARGVIGQFYRYLERSGSNMESQDLMSVISTHFDLHSGIHTAEHELDVRLDGYHLYDEMEDGDHTDMRLRRAHLDYTHANTGFGATAGRQRDFRSGVFHSFDGITLRYPIDNKWSVAASYGEPVTFSDTYDDLDHQFTSVQTSYALSDQWTFSAYAISQKVYSETDRLAYGGEAKYMGDKLASYLNFDYDYEFGELNNLLWGATYRLEDGSVSARYGRQRSPFLTATNILIGQTQLDLRDYLSSEFNREYLMYYALQRTSQSEFGALSYSKNIDQDLQLTVDVYQSVLSEMPVFVMREALEGEEAQLEAEMVAKGDQYRYSSVGVQMVAMSFLTRNDTASISLRHEDTSTLSANQLQLSERLRFGNLSVNPRVSLRHTSRKSDDRRDVTTRGSVALSYRLWRNAELRMEVGTEHFKNLDDKNSITSTFLYAGYQARF